MHRYTIDHGEREKTLVILLILSIIIAIIVYLLTNNIYSNLPTWVSFIWSPSIFFLYGFFYLIYDKWLWKYLSYLEISKIPDLNGTWTGYVKTSYDLLSNQNLDKAPERPSSITINQTWTDIAILLKTDKSKSYSIMAGIYLCDCDEKTIRYIYHNNPEYCAEDDLRSHEGSVRLVITQENNKRILNGYYYNGKGRQNYGILCFEQILDY